MSLLEINKTLLDKSKETTTKQSYFIKTKDGFSVEVNPNSQIEIKSNNHTVRIDFKKDPTVKIIDLATEIIFKK